MKFDVLYRLLDETAPNWSLRLIWPAFDEIRPYSHVT